MQEVKDEFAKLLKDNTAGALSYQWDVLQISPAVKFNDTCVECVSRSAFAQFEKSQVRQIWSGAGHDSCQTAPHVPTSMIFILRKMDCLIIITNIPRQKKLKMVSKCYCKPLSTMIITGQQEITRFFNIV